MIQCPCYIWNFSEGYSLIFCRSCRKFLQFVLNHFTTLLFMGSFRNNRKLDLRVSTTSSIGGASIIDCNYFSVLTVHFSMQFLSFCNFNFTWVEVAPQFLVKRSHATFQSFQTLRNMMHKLLFYPSIGPKKSKYNITKQRISSFLYKHTKPHLYMICLYFWKW